MHALLCSFRINEVDKCVTNILLRFPVDWQINEVKFPIATNVVQMVDQDCSSILVRNVVDHEGGELFGFIDVVLPINMSWNIDMRDITPIPRA